MRQLAHLSWGANAEVLRTSARLLVYSTAENCAHYLWTDTILKF